MKRKFILYAACGAVLLAALAVGLLSAAKGYFVLAPSRQLQLLGEESVEVAAHSTYKDAGFLARKGEEDLSAQVVVEGAVDTAVPGSYTLLYRLPGGSKELVVQRTVTVVDREAPLLELAGEKEMKISARHLYKEPGFTATDRCDGDVTAAVRVTETLEGDVLTLTYTVADRAGNETVAQRIITVRDEAAPALTLRGKGEIYVPVGGRFSDPGCTAQDDVDGDLTAAVKVSGGVNTGSAGTYALTYAVADKAGNRAEVKRTVKVYSYTPNSANRLYLTFDDGPSDGVTVDILNTLAAFDAKATFFIVNYSSGNRHLIQRMINEGHTVAIHGYSHDYATIYANDEAFMTNVYRLRDKLLADFGYNATIIRFPGGSSNSVSAAYNSGIMSRLVKRVEEEGFSYFDWNVSSGDASGGGASSSSIYHNVTSGIRPGRTNVVLMHDTNAKWTTANALEDILHYARANGYVMLPITPSTTPVHHGVTN